MTEQSQEPVPFRPDDRAAAHGRQSRREFLYRSVAAAFSVPAVSMLLAACGGDDDEDGDEEPTATTAPGDEAEPTPTEAASDDGEATEESESEDGETEPTAAETAAEPVSPGGQAIARFVDEPDTLFSGASGSTRHIWVMSFIANALTKLSQPDQDVVPDLAESWEISPDGLTYTFTLHQGVTWHDGEPFSFDDIKFSFELWAHPEWPGPLGPNIAPIEGAQAYKDGEATEISGIRMLDEQQVEFTLAEPYAPFLSGLGFFWLLPQHILADVPPADAAQDPFARQPIYTGPFKLDEWRAGESLSFSAFPDYFGGPPRLESLVIRIITDPATAVADVQTGGVQLTDVLPDQFDSFTDNEEFSTQQLDGPFFWFLVFDLSNPLFEDPRVRQAMYHAIDRETIASALFQDRVSLGFSILPPTSWIFNPDIPEYGFDPERANALLEEAGWEMGSDGVRVKDGQSFEFTMLVITRTNEWAIAVQPFLEDVGIRFDLEQVEFGTFISRLAQRDYQGAVWAWPNSVIDPRIGLANNFRTPRATDWTTYSNDEVNQLFDQAFAATDRDEEIDLYGQIQVIAEGEPVYVHLWQPHDLIVVRNELQVPEVSTTTELFARVPEWELRS